MVNAKEHTKHLEVTRKILAFNLFREEGMNAVKSMYPELLEFVRANKEKSLREVKIDLLNASHA